MFKTLILIAASVVAALAHHENIQARGIVKLEGSGIQGNITFTQLPENKIHVTGSIFGLPPGIYGFHVHEKGDLTGGCASAGGHFNPDHKDHGHPNDENRHVGDLGNIVFDENRESHLDFVDSVISLMGPHGILGRAVVLHERADDFGRSAHPDSKKTGNAGGRVACGVIGILEPVYGWDSSGASVRVGVTSTLFFMIFSTTAFTIFL